MKKKKGFTLAEVLITLAIIGVVAALTVPTVVTNYKNKALETQSKKAMSALANGFRMLMAEDGVTSLQNTKFVSCGMLNKACISNEMKRIFNIIADNNSENDIFNTTYYYRSAFDEVWKGNNVKYAFVTSDGTIFGVSFETTLCGMGTSCTEKLLSINVIADVNGIKNPNKGGEDLRKYRITPKGEIIDLSSSMGCSVGNFFPCNQEQCDALGIERPKDGIHWDSDQRKCVSNR